MSGLGGSPMMLWGSVDPVAASPWGSTGGSLTATGSQADPFGGTSAVSLNDTDAAGQSYRYRAATISQNGSPLIGWFLKQGTSTLNILDVYDNTASVARHQVNVSWSGGTPTLSTRAGAGTLYTPISVGASFWYVRFTADGVLAANVNRIRIFPANNSSDTGTVIVYRRSAALLNDAIDNVVNDEDPLEGSEWVEAPSGVLDGWYMGTKYQLALDVGFIPPTDVSTPFNVSGWDGLGEDIGVNCGMAAMLRAGRKRLTLRWVPDRTAVSAYSDCQMLEPMQGGVEPERNNGLQRRFRMKLLTTTAPFAHFT